MKPDQFMKIIDFAMKVKARMKELGKSRVRVVCPDHPKNYIWATLAGKRQHLHMSCEVENCRYRMME